MKTHKGSCHCGTVTYEVQADFTKGMTCNCSHCKQKSILWDYVPVETFTLLTGKENLTTYHFNTHNIDHLFCKTCGVESYAYGHDGNKNYMYAINLHCIQDLDETALEITEYDGASS